MPSSGERAAPSGAGADSLAAISARVTEVESTLRQSSGIIDISLAREAEDRSWIARAILWVFVISVAIVLLILWTEGIVTKEWNPVALQAADLIKTSVLPVVTLVLGFYFGSRSGKG
jgi:hypothetical protein